MVGVFLGPLGPLDSEEPNLDWVQVGCHFTATGLRSVNQSMLISSCLMGIYDAIKLQ